ncbi:hypothetical protein QBC46DRAFT_461462 [Diplogelasinospora grovesii]|uniref:Uncharacterized protein n=1 Tax=Diplogelasinospora grovesii TaxID=303347 RepID=A0AAN6N262_9PEZI|nr:hypothetical protein QBC46DRAFT_461462 [Diplogelasinospora grovesii]
MPSIKGHAVLVIGGSSGIGFAVSKLALAEGCRVAIASSNPTRVSNAIGRLENAVPGGSLIGGYTCDLNSDDVEARMEKLLTNVIDDLNKNSTEDKKLLDHIVFTAGMITDLKPVSQTSVSHLRGAGGLLFCAPLIMAKLLTTPGRFVTASYRSSLTLTGGRLSEKPLADYTVASAYASALHGMTKGLALDMAPNLRVNFVAPGATDTELWGEEGSPGRLAYREMCAKAALLGRPADPEDVAEAYIYLMKDPNVTGTAVHTSGGVLLQ